MKGGLVYIPSYKCHRNIRPKNIKEYTTFFDTPFPFLVSFVFIYLQKKFPSIH